MFEVKRINVLSRAYSDYGNEIASNSIAYMMDDEGWQDPHGGVFNDEHKNLLDEVVTGKRTSGLFDKLYTDLYVTVEFKKR